MCKSQADGGQRCAAHTRPRFNAAKIGTAEWDTAAGEYAATREGMTVLTAMRDGAEKDGDWQTASACTSALGKGTTIQYIAAQTRAEVNRQTGAVRTPKVEHNDHWGDWTVNCGGYGMIEDDGMPRWSSDQPTEEAARKVEKDHATISKVVRDYQTNRGLNPALKTIRLRITPDADGGLELKDYDWGHDVGYVAPDGGSIIAAPPADRQRV